MPKEANITGAIRYIPLEADDEKWSNIIVEMCQDGTIFKEREQKSVQQCNLIRQSGYDISDVVNKLEVFYSNCLKS